MDDTRFKDIFKIYVFKDRLYHSCTGITHNQVKEVISSKNIVREI